MPTHISWSSIELLHNADRTLNFLNERDGQPLPTVEYRGKVKLHGTNCAVQVTTRGGVYAQSRKQMLVDGVEYKGFAKWVEAHKSFWKALRCPEDVTVFGEWCGSGVEKGMAISKIDRKVFAVFAIQYNRGEKAFVQYDPEAINAVLDDLLHPDVFILPWLPFTLTLNYGDEEAMATAAKAINQIVDEIEREDPWVKDIFGISGLGEGVVFYPVGDHLNVEMERLATLMFKAKGDKHRVAGRKAAQVKPEAAAGVPEFVTMMVTEARLQQGVSEACGGELNMRHTGNFLKWVAEDVQKESEAELEAAGLTWGQVAKAVQTKTRDWYKEQALGR